MSLEGFVPFPTELAERYRAAGYWEDRSLASFFDEICQKYADRIALIVATTGESVTYAQVADRATKLAQGLLASGLQPGDTVVMQLPNVPEFVYLYLALQKAGIRPVMALPGHRYTEVSHFVKLGQAVGYALPRRLGDFDFLALARQLQAENPALRHLLVLGEDLLSDLPDAVSLAHLLNAADAETAQLPDVAINPLEPALFLLSGGTTGVPKLIPRTHNDYIYNSKAAAAVNDIRPDDALLAILPLAHNFPLACPGIQGFLLSGARVVLATSTQNKDILGAIERHKITHLELVPTLLIRLLNDADLTNYDLSSLRVVNSGGQRLQPEIKRRAEELMPSCKVQEVFGMAEGLLCFVRLDDPDTERYETVGRPVSPGDEIRLVDEEGQEVPEGATGELLVRGPYTLHGYYRAAEHNARTFTPDGFYRTGDLMRRLPSGNYSVEGRKKDLINRGGEKISAEEIENIMLAHPAVLNVACVPMPDALLGERVCAVVVLKPGASLTLEELTSFMSQKGIAKFKLPERLEVRDELPLSKVGKVAKNVLVKELAEVKPA